MKESIRIAWVEDDSAIIDPVVFRLERAAYQIDRYTSYSDAMLAKDVILASQLILLDIIIPNGGPDAGPNPYLGITLIEQLYSIAVQREITFPPVLILSAVSQEQIVKNFRNAFQGKFAISHLRKPTLPSHLKDRVEQILGATGD
jgi:CheY-like chemotaxis protein